MCLQIGHQVRLRPGTRVSMWAGLKFHVGGAWLPSAVVIPPFLYLRSLTAQILGAEIDATNSTSDRVRRSSAEYIMCSLPMWCSVGLRVARSK